MLRTDKRIDRALRGWADRKRPSTNHLDALADRILREAAGRRIHEVQEAEVETPQPRRVIRWALAGAAVAAMLALAYLGFVAPQTEEREKSIEKTIVDKGTEEAKKLPPMVPGELWQHDEETVNALALAAAHQPETPEFLRTLQEIATSLPVVPVGREHGASTFTHVRMNAGGQKIDAVRFRVPEGVKTDVVWALRYPDAAHVHVYLAPVEGVGLIELKDTYEREDWYGTGPLEKRGEMELKTHWLAADTVEPGREYIMCLAYSGDTAVDVGVAFNALEVPDVKWDEYSVLKALGEYKGDWEHDQGHAAAHRHEGEPGLAKAVEWYKKAAELGNVPSMLHMGDAYANGRGVEQDLEEAEKWYEKYRDLTPHPMTNPEEVKGFRAGLKPLLDQVPMGSYGIIMVPFGGAELSLMKEVAHDMSTMLGVPVLVQQKAIPLSPAGRTRKELQWDAHILHLLLKEYTKANGRPRIGFIGVTSKDIYMEGNNYLFGWSPTGHAIMSYRRFTGEFRGKQTFRKQLRQRVRNQCISNAGLMYDIPRCEEKACPRAYVRSVRAHDRKEVAICVTCRKGFAKLFGVAGTPLYETLWTEDVAAAKSKVRVAPVSDEPLGTVKAMLKDTAVPGCEWIIYETKFLGVKKGGRLQNFEAFAGVMNLEKIDVRDLAFTTTNVWAATDKGAFNYDRRRDFWCEYAVNREHIGMPVAGVEADGHGTVTFSMMVDGLLQKYTYNPRTGEWVK